MPPVLPPVTTQLVTYLSSREFEGQVDGSVVGPQWTDNTVFLNHYTFGNSPTKQTLHGIPVVDLNGTNQYAEIGATTDYNTAGVFTWMVIGAKRGTSTRSLFSHEVTGYAGPTFRGYMGGAVAYTSAYSAGTRQLARSNTRLNEFAVWCGRCDTVPLLTQFVDQWGSGPDYNQAFAITTSPHVRTRIGARVPSLGEYWDGYVYEVYIWNRALSDAELAVMRDYASRLVGQLNMGTMQRFNNNQIQMFPSVPAFLPKDVLDGTTLFDDGEQDDPNAVAMQVVNDNYLGLFQTPSGIIVKDPLDGTTKFDDGIQDFQSDKVLIHVREDFTTGVDPRLYLGEPELTGPSINTVTADANKVVTVDGNAGPGNLGLCVVSYEVDLGGTDKFIYVDPALVNLGPLTSINFSFDIPEGLNFDGKQGRLVVTGTGLLSGEKFQSTPYLMVGDNFNNVPVVSPVYTDANPQILSESIDDTTHIANIIAEAGPTDAPLVTVRWEAVLVPDEITIVLLERVDEPMTVRRTFNDSVQVPETLNMQNTYMRFTVIPQDGPLVET